MSANRLVAPRMSECVVCGAPVANPGVGAVPSCAGCQEFVEQEEGCGGISVDHVIGRYVTRCASSDGESMDLRRRITLETVAE